jgi:hypothetical protein
MFTKEKLNQKDLIQMRDNTIPTMSVNIQIILREALTEGHIKKNEA